MRMRIIVYGVLSLLIFQSVFLEASKIKKRLNNQEAVFDSSPKFSLDYSPKKAKKVHWQISNTPLFDWISPILENVGDSSSLIVVPPEIAHDQLIRNQVYYFRYKTVSKKKNSAWSRPFRFSVGLPSPLAYHWKYNPDVDEATWHALLPYFLPSNHPLKNKLDAIFSSSRVTANLQTLQAAGFKNLEGWKWDKVIVAKHPHLPGYLIKACLDDQYALDDKYLIHRIFGAEAIRSAIEENGYEEYFKVPHKWIYPLPQSFTNEENGPKKHFILVVEDMDILDKEENRKMFRQIKSKKQLSALYHLISSQGLPDSIYIKNIPFAKDGKIAFVDTERYQLWPVEFSKLAPLLSRKMKKHWQKLVDKP